MRVATVDGLVTLFYDGSRELYDWYLHKEWGCKSRFRYEDDWKEWEKLDLSDECREYWRERQSWQQVIVMEGVTVIQQKTFQCCFNIKKVIFANTVVRIEYWAFFRCYSLVYIKLSINLEYMGELSFQGCNLFSVFIPPECKEMGSEALAYNENLKIVNVPQDVELKEGVLAGTKLLFDSPFGDEDDRYDHTREEVHNWTKNINNDEKYALHRTCTSFQPSKQVIFTIIEEKEIGSFSVENEAGITPSQYLKENPYADIDEMEIIREYVSKMMGEIGKI